MRNKSKRPEEFDNQFMSQPQINNTLLSSPKDIRTQITTKDSIIKNLEQRNQKLKYELSKINQILQQKGDQQKKVQHKLIPIQFNEQTMKKQLQNAYKHIKNYEIQIKRLQSNQQGGLLTTRMQKLQQIYSQKLKHIQKIKNQIQAITKTNNQNGKKLKDNNLKQQLQNHMLKLNEQIKFLRQRVKDTQLKQKQKQTNAKKQYDYIKDLQKNLLELGCTHQQLQQLRSRNIYNKDKVTNITNQDNNNNEKQLPDSIQQLTLDRYYDIRNQIKLLKKLQGDYEKKIQILNKERQEAQKRNLNSRNKLVECQTEIQQLERQIKLLKSQVKPQMMRPLRSISTTQGVMKTDKLKRISTSIQKLNKSTLNHILKFDQVGLSSDKGQRFTDRNILSKITVNKITGINAFINKSNGLIAGIQVIYLFNERRISGGQYIRKDRDTKDPYYENENFQCQQGDYIKSINGSLDPSEHVQYLNIVTQRGKNKKFSQLKTLNKQFTFDIAQNQIPVCIFGSLLIKNEGKKDISMIQHLGFEVNEQITQKKGKKTNNQASTQS